jgi:hypothetical protein
MKAMQPRITITAEATAEYDEIFGAYSPIEIDSETPEEEIEQLKSNILIDSPQYADWAIRRIKTLRNQRDKMMELYNTQKEQLERYRKSEEDRIGRNEEFWTYQLKGYFEQLKEQEVISSKQKSYKLPHGTIGTRKLPYKWDFSGVNIHELYEIDPELVKMEVKRQEAKSKLEYVGDDKAVHKESGLIITGVRVDEQEDSFYVKPAE